MSYREFLNKLLIGNEGSSGGASSWEEITDKPSAFPPSAHTHAQADVTGLPDVASKAHTHANKTTLDKFGETNGKPTFDGTEIGGSGDVDESRLLPDPVNYGQQNNGWRVGLEVLGIEDRDDFLCLYTLNEIVQGLPLDATGKTTATNQGVALELVEDEGAFEGKAVRRASTQNSSVANKLVIPMPEISGPFTLDIRFKAGAGSPGVGGEGTTYALAGAAVTTPAGQLGYHCGDVSPFKAVQFNALEYRADSHGLPWKVFDSPGWYWFRMCRNNTAVYVFMNGEKVNSTTNSQALVTIPAGNWTILPSDTDSDVLLDEVRITNTCESTDDYAVPTESTGGIARKWKLYSESAAPGSDVDESRLLPDPATVSANLAGHPVVFDVQEQGGTGDANTLLLMHLDNDVVDYSPNAHSATKTGDVAFQTGKFGKCLKFAAATGGSYLQIPYSTAFNLANRSAWTFDVWVYISQTPGYSAILAQRQASSPCSYQFCFSSGTRKPQLYTGSAYVATGEVPLNTWTHVAFTYLNRTLKIWIGGQLDSTFTNVALTDYGLPIEIGYHYSSTAEQFVGLLDELRLSSCDRTADPTDPMYSADGTSFTPPAKPYGVTSNRFKVSDQPAGTVSSVNGVTPDSSGAVTIPAATASAAGLMAAADKAKLDGISTSEASWYTVADAAAITLDRTNGELQKVTLTQNCVLTAPTLDADNPTLLLQITSSTAVTVKVGETEVISGKTGAFQIGWFWDGSAARRYPVVEVV